METDDKEIIELARKFKWITDKYKHSESLQKVNTTQNVIGRIQNLSKSQEIALNGFNILLDEKRQNKIVQKKKFVNNLKEMINFLVSNSGCVNKISDFASIIDSNETSYYSSTKTQKKGLKNKKPKLSQYITKLEKTGWIICENDRKDKRNKLVKLSTEFLSLK